MRRIGHWIGVHPLISTFLAIVLMIAAFAGGGSGAGAGDGPSTGTTSAADPSPTSTPTPGDASLSLQKTAALTNHFQKTTTGMMVFLVVLQVFCQIADAFRKNGNLDFRGSRVSFVDAVGFDQFFLSCRC